MVVSAKLVAAGVATVAVGAGWYLNRRLDARVQQLAAPAAHPPTRFATSAPAPEEHQQHRKAKKNDFDVC